MDNLSTLPGVGITTQEKLETNGLNSFMAIATSSPTEISTICGLSENKARAIIKACREQVSLGFETARSYSTKRDKINKIGTGCSNFDEVLDGGFESSTVTEVYGRTAAGKCVEKNTKIFIDGELIPIKDLWNDTTKKKFDDGEICNCSSNVISWSDVNNKFEKETATSLYREKVKTIYKIETEKGRILKLTGNHKLPTFDCGIDWKKTSQFNTGDFIRIPKMNYTESNKLDRTDAYFIGLFVAEGTGNPVSISNENPKTIEFIKNYIKIKDNYEPTIRKDKRNNVKVVLIRNKTRDRILKDLANTNSATKFIPTEIMLASESIKLSFMEGYLDGDGYSNKTNKMSMCTKSKRLSIQLNYILNMLKLETTTKIKTVKDYGDFYNISIVGNGNNEKISTSIKKCNNAKCSVYGYPNTILKYLRRQLNRLSKNDKRGIKTFFKTSAYNYITNKYNVNKRFNNRIFDDLLRYFNPASINKPHSEDNFRKYNIHSETYNAIIDVTNYEWDKIVKISRIKYDDYVYDLVVPKNHNFIGGDKFTLFHNTQLSHLMVVRALLEDKENKAIYIDSESTFRADRIKDFAEANGLDPEEVLDRIFVARSYNTDHQLLLVDELEKILQEDNTYRILVVDSLTSHFRADFSGRGELAPRQQKLNKHLHQLLKLADLYNLVVIVTNQVSSNPAIMYGNPETPIGGNILSHSVTSILYVRPAKAGTWCVKLVDSPNLPVSEANYSITKNGFENVK